MSTTQLNTMILSHMQRAFDPVSNQTEIWTTHTVYDAVYHNLYYGTVFVVDPPPGLVLMSHELDFIVSKY